MTIIIFIFQGFGQQQIEWYHQTNSRNKLKDTELPPITVSCEKHFFKLRTLLFLISYNLFDDICSKNTMIHNYT